MSEIEESKALLIKENEQLKDENKLLKIECEEFRLMHETCQHNTRKLHKEKKDLDDFIDNNPLSIQIVDSEGFTKRTNRVYDALFKARPKVEYSVFNDPTLIKLGFQSEMERIKRGETVIFPDHMYNANWIDPTYPDIPLWLTANGFPIFGTDGKPESYVFIHNDITERKKLEAEKEEKNKQLTHLNNYINSVRENERKYLANEIHDKFSTALANIKRRMLSVREYIHDEVTIKEIDYAVFLADDARSVVKKLIDEIRQDILKNLGIISAVRTYARVFERKNNIKVMLNLDDELSINPEVSHVLYRVIQESLNNIACHAKADRAVITLNETNNNLNCTITDNGVGIRLDETDLNKSYGIFSMKEGIEKQGGSFQISGKRNIGTTVIITLPASLNY